VPEGPKGSGPLSLGKRERQIAETLYQLGEASVADVLERLPAPPTYSAVRAMLNVLVGKGVVEVRQDGKRYLYKPALPKEKIRKSVLRNLVRNFFAGDPADAVAALLDGSGGKLSGDDLTRIRQLIDEAERNQDSN